MLPEVHCTGKKTAEKDKIDKQKQRQTGPTIMKAKDLSL